jgi:hypothetical protein
MSRKISWNMDCVGDSEHDVTQRGVRRIGKALSKIHWPLTRYLKKIGDELAAVGEVDLYPIPASVVSTVSKTVHIAWSEPAP